MTASLIRRAGPADAETLARIGRETFVETFGHLYPAEDLAAYLASAYELESTRAGLADPGQASWLVEAHDGSALGYATAGPCGLPHPEVGPGALELKRIYFRRAVQGGGRGGQLFDAVMAWMAGRAPSDLWIGVWSENLGAQRFYARRGFVKVGEYGFPVGRTLDREFILRRRPAF
ncbi:MAG: GNAT family N-acetyltransferase [Phenylobacterium sp.]